MKFLLSLIPALLNMLASLVGKIIAALGITAMTYTGLDLLINQFKGQIQSAVHGVPAGLLQMFYLSGGGVVLNILFGCLTFVLTFKTLSKLVPRGKKA